MEDITQDLLNLNVEDLLKQQIELHTEKAKFHTEKAEKLQNQLRLLTGVNTLSFKPNGHGIDVPIHLRQGLGFGDIKISKTDVETFLENFSDRPHKTEEIVAGTGPEYLNDPDLRKLAISKVSQILMACIKQGRVNKHKSAGKGNRYKMNKGWLEKLEDMRERL